MKTRATATHEAGHAVAHLLLGLPFVYVTIDPQEGESMGLMCIGHMFCVTRCDSEESDRDRQHRVLAEVEAWYGGAAGEHLCCGTPLDAICGARVDYREAYHAFVEEFGPYFADDEIWPLLRALKHKAVRLLRPYVGAIERVAAALVEANTLTQAQVVAVVEGREWRGEP